MCSTIMSMSTELSSPTFTATSTASSFDLISRSRSSSLHSLEFSEDDDEIVWSIPSSGMLSPSLSTESSVVAESEDDFVLLQVQPPSTRHDTVDNIISGLASLSVGNTPAKRKTRSDTPPAAVPPDRPSSVATIKSPAKNRKRTRKPKLESATSTGLGSRPIVDDISEGVSEPLEDVSTSSSAYDDAVHYINTFLTNPNDSHCNRLDLYQALCIELLGLSCPPASVRSAKAYLKSKAFVNIRDYLALRGQGPGALQSAMYPSRSALIKDIRRKRNQASLKWVKQSGLQVLLVSCFH